jgi:small subunit ribosomal protein S20
MPLIKSAIKKVRKDKTRTKRNARYVEAYKQALKKLKKGGTDLKKLASEFYTKVDKAVKRRVIHKNKANRLKSRVSKFLKKLSTKAKTSK